MLDTICKECWNEDCKSDYLCTDMHKHPEDYDYDYEKSVAYNFLDDRTYYA